MTYRPLILWLLCHAVAWTLLPTADCDALDAGYAT